MQKYELVQGLLLRRILYYTNIVNYNRILTLFL